ncbi:MAG: hypothetical protein IPM82_23530 [Saprospiraceae bacterium]|nr:hypothetical protein [Saprospiraceae bacterium]
MADKTTFTILTLKEKSSVGEFEDLYNNVAAGIGGNPLVFVTPSPTLLVFKAGFDALKAADVADNLANDASRIVLKEKKVEFLELLRQMAAYVLGVANGSRYIAELSGFKLSKATTTPKVQTGIVVIERRPGPGDGEASVRINKGGFDMVIVELKLEDNSWKMIGAFTLSKFILKGLPSGSSNIRITGYKGDVPGTVDGSVVETVVKAV